jgi:hypothetical protein
MRLSVEPGQIAKIAFKNRPRLAEVLTAWVAENLDRALQPARVVQISFMKSPDIQERRIDRISHALDRKLPKLLAAAGAQRRSILILEERDSNLSSPAEVSLALQAAAIGRQLPGVVYLVDTCRGDPRLLRLHEDGEWAHDGDNRFNSHPFPVERASHFNVLPSGWA